MRILPVGVKGSSEINNSRGLRKETLSEIVYVIILLLQIALCHTIGHGQGCSTETANRSNVPVRIRVKKCATD